MFNKIEFSDLYKFITSTGLIIIGLAFLIPWLFLKQDQGLTISEKDYKLLNDNARLLLNSKIEFNLLVSKWLYLISAIILVIGVFLLIIGTYKWYKKQKLIDEMQLLEIAEKRAKLKTLDNKEVVQKAGIEVTDELNSIESYDNQTEISSQKFDVLKSDLIRIEEYIYKRLLEYNPPNYRISNNIKIADKYQVDLLLNSYKISSFDDILIEIKYLQNNLNIDYIRKAFIEFKIIFSNYTTSTKRNGKMVFLVILKENIFDENQIELFEEKFNELSKKEKNSRIKFQLLRESAIEDFEISELII